MLAQLSLHELDDHVTVRDVVAVVQRAEMVRRLSDEVTALSVELGGEGRLVRLQHDELVEDVDRERGLLLRDYTRGTMWRDGGRAVLSRLDTDELLDAEEVARAIGLSDHGRALPPSALLQPKGYRLLSRIPRLGDGVIDHVVAHFGTLSRLRSASVSQLTEVDGVGDVRARAIREGLARVMESVALDLRGR